ncbi:undecaprenyl-diphosphate phosphatase [Actinomarinicola tropica]|uniref:Undecaprenyl-diphosphatase n=1 Tax=Actinomarinicola tropica TaxID=2789776 RepID=A0A5Q2RP85_9ACTN|nr:undecaprenyl-diphosphate phosphatase [Actinomarinicola tropica]QGG96246.1 undecaprenyl-diphosphate phosphatase [Actinomarinicola tropica]
MIGTSDSPVIEWIHRSTRLIAAAVGLGLLLLAGMAAMEAGDTALSIPEALLLGVIEGLTEFLPVSSTGHLTVVQELLGLTTSADAERSADAYAIIIQSGAILAVAVLYRTRIAAMLHGFKPGARHEPDRRLALALVMGFVPAGIVGLVAGDLIKEHLFGLWPTILAWAVGGVVLLAWPTASRSGKRSLKDVTVAHGAAIGVIQLIAMWPGVSRSLVTILAALILGYTMAAAVEFSFLLGVVTLGAATTYEAWDNGAQLISQFGVIAPAAGFLASLISAAAAVAWMVRYLERRGLAVFGWYRLAVAGVVGAAALVSGT